MKHLALLILFVLSACAQTTKFTLGDVTNSAVIATKAGDTQAATCWISLSGALMPSPDPASDGIAVLVERQRLFQGIITGPCAPLILQILMQLGALGLHVPLGGL